jgi:6-phosphogluconolactonase
VPEAEALARAAAETFVRAMREAVAARGRGTVALSGGSTPKRMAELLAGAPYREQVPWTNLEIFWGDERWVPLASPDSNAGEAKRLLLDRVPVEPARVNPFPTPETVADPRVAAEMYEAQLRLVFGAAPEVPVFDLILLGLGDDGHTASLFPGHPEAFAEHAPVIGVRGSPKPPPERITLTLPVIARARHTVLLATGAGKREALARVRARDEALPISRLGSALDEIVCDEEAAATA